MSEREHMLKRLATYDFASVELHLYLDTHPFDKSTIRKLNEIEEKAKVLRNEYEEKYGPLSPASMRNNPHLWISSPWPWDGGEE